MKQKFLSLVAIITASFAASGAWAAIVVLPNLINAANSPYVCSSVDTYIINGKVVVADGGLLQIEAGTVLKANKILPNTAASAILVSRGGVIEALGSNTSPVVFTSNEATPSMGDWGGIVILGRASNNRITNPAIEGIDGTSLPAGTDFNYGPIPAISAPGVPAVGIDNESSGILNYVRIEYAGAAISANNELNALTMGSVGNGTEIDFVQSLHGGDDAFEWFGGTVNAKHLVAVGTDDDDFDFDFGYSGKLQFIVSLRKPEKPAYSSDPNGIESDNNNDGGAFTGTPRTLPKIANATIIGLVDSLSAGVSDPLPGVSRRLLRGNTWRRNSGLDMRNSIMMGFNTGIDFLNGASGSFVHNVVSAFRTIGGTALDATNLQFQAGNPAGANYLAGMEGFANFGIELVDPFNGAGSPDFRPSFSSPTAIKTGANWTGVTDPFFQQVTYRGAFPANTNWARVWCKFTDWQ